MKKEVTVCDHTGCRSLADVVCSICDRDVCNVHGNRHISTSMTIESNEGGSERTIVSLRREFTMPCCVSCSVVAQDTLQVAGIPSDTLLQPLSAQIIEYLRACFAAVKLKSKP